MTTQVIDGLKARSYGFKKSLEEKEQRIHQKHERGERYYPASQKEGVDEWGVFPRKIQEFNEKVNQNEKTFKTVLRADLKNTYENQKQEKEMRHKEDLMEKEELGKKIRNDDRSFQNRQQMANQQIRHLRQDFNSENQHLLHAKKEQDTRLKLMAKEEEMKRLKEVEESLRIEKEMRQQKLNQYRADIQTVNTLSDMKRKMERNQSTIEMEHDKQRIQDYIENELRKDKAYNSHFQTVNQIQKANQEKYLNSIADDMQRKMVSIQRENDDMQRYNKFKAEQARAMEKQRMDMINGVYTENKSQINDREHFNVQLKNEEQKRNSEIREAMRKNLEDYNRVKKEEAIKQRNLYKETLDRQQQSKEFEKRYYGNMSRVEKEFNRFDLRTYKKKENDINCMIPGIRNIPSVGSQPTRGGDPLIKMHQQMLNSASYGEGSSPNVLKKNHTTATLHTPAGANSPSIVSDDKKRATEKAMSHTSLYNPITNPLPGYQQNPYLLRQRSPINGNGAAGVGDSFTSRRSSNQLQHAGFSVLDKSL